MALYTPDLLRHLRHVVARALQRFAWPETTRVTLVTVSENATFRLNDGGKKAIMRVYRPGYHNNHEIASELQWMRALAAEETVRLPQVFTTESGESFLEHQGWRLACFEYLPGREPQMGNDLTQTFFQLGAMTAKLHDQSRYWQPPAYFQRKEWVFDTMVGSAAYWGNWRTIPCFSQADRDLISRCAQTLETVTRSFGRDREHFGLIHGDLRAANLIRSNGQLAAIDFDDCGFSWYAQDLANALSFIEHEKSVSDLIQAWFAGYSQDGRLVVDMRQILPALIMMRRLQLSAWLASRVETPTAAKLGEDYHRGTLLLARRWLEGTMDDKWR